MKYYCNLNLQVSDMNIEGLKMNSEYTIMIEAESISIALSELLNKWEKLNVHKISFVIKKIYVAES